MAMTREQFQTRLTESGIMSVAEITAFEAGLPNDANAQEDPSSLAKALVAAECITPFQAEILLGESSSPLRLGNYLLLDRVGSGGMGHVHKAVHERMNRIVAVKVLPPSLAMDADLVARFRREVQVAAKLHHPNIVTAYDADEADGVHFLVMELVDGRDLGEILAADGPLTIEEAMDYTQQAARALAYAHAEGVLHRDVKPANLLVDAKGHLKVLDMGLARLDASDGLTTTGDVIGTAATMAPEQGEDIRLVDERSDVYGLGCTLFYMLTGGHMYEGDSAIQVLLAHARAPVPSLRGVRSDAPEALERLFESMVQKRRDDRLPSMQAVMEGLDAIRAGRRPVVPTPAPARTPKPRRHRALVIGGLAILIAALIGVWLASDQQQAAHTPAAETAPTLLLRTLRGHQGAVHSVAFHPDGARLVSASGDHTIGLWDVKTGRMLQRLKGHTDSVRSVVCLSDGETIISSSDDLTIRIWDLASQKTRQVLRGHTAKVRQLALMPDEQSLISVSKDGTLRVWELPSGTQRLERSDHDEWVGDNQGFLSVAVRADGAAVATAAFDRTVRLWDTEGYGVSRTLGPHASDVGIVSYSSDGRFLLYDLESGQLRVMSSDGREDVARLAGHEDWIYSIAACPGRSIAATGSQDTLIMLWHVPSGERLATLVGHTYTVGALDFSPNGKLLASGAGDETVRLWDVASLTNTSD